MIQLYHTDQSFSITKRDKNNTILNKTRIMKENTLYRESVVHRSGGLPMRIYESSHVKYHYHDEYEFLLAEQDETVCFVGGKQFTLNLGDSIMIKGGELHSLSLGVGKSVTAIVVHPSFFGGEDVASFEKLSFTSIFRGDTPVGKEITDLLRKIKACYFAKKAGYEILLRAYFCNIFAILVENGEFEQNIRDEKPQNPAEAAIFEYIHQNLRESITLDTLSEISHFSNSYVIRLFKKSTGQTPTEYVNRCRISLAKKLLESKSVTETALDCGFNNISYFIRTFKRYTGVTPKEWRGGN